MQLEVKRPDHIVPSYSLTGDLLSYSRCRLQYRFHGGSSLPPSRPVQLWTGEFLHGTLEQAFRFWAENHAAYPFPWPCTQRDWRGPEPAWAPNDIGAFANAIEMSLRRQGKWARSTAARNAAYRRVEHAVNQLGPHLFPLIASAERKVIGTRPIPIAPRALRCSHYEVHGVIDVLTNVTIGAAGPSNAIKDAVEGACPLNPGEYEVIVDYKGTRRYNVGEPYWDQGEWQIQTYAWLRQAQPESLPVAAGLLVYLNELSPGDSEMTNLKSAIASGRTDVLPAPGSRDEQLVRMWRSGMATDQLSLPFRLRRAIRVIPISDVSRDIALQAFDSVVLNIETDVMSEADGGTILNAWAPNCQDEESCAACDFRHFCPCPHPVGRTPGYVPTTPGAP
jgi:hypothetical protein